MIVYNYLIPIKIKTLPLIPAKVATTVKIMIACNRKYFLPQVLQIGAKKILYLRVLLQIVSLP